MPQTHKVNNVVNPNIPQASVGTQPSPLAGISLSSHQDFRHSIFSNGETAFRYFYLLASRFRVFLLDKILEVILGLWILEQQIT